LFLFNLKGLRWRCRLCWWRMGRSN